MRFRTAYRPKIRGEATASYAAMDRDLVQEIAVLKPDAKVLLMVRNPVDRAWSHAKKDLARNRGRQSADIGEEEWQAFFRDPYQVRCARYEENIATWRSCFPADNVFIGTFEEVEDQPAQLLQKVTRFLGVSDDPRYVDSELLSNAVNRTGRSEIPENFRRYLEGLFAREIEEWQRIVATARSRPTTAGLTSR